MFKLYNYLEKKTQQEEGEVASWLILAAGLALAAGAASTVLSGVISELANNVRSAAGL